VHEQCHQRRVQRGEFICLRSCAFKYRNILYRRRHRDMHQLEKDDDDDHHSMTLCVTGSLQVLQKVTYRLRGAQIWARPLVINHNSPTATSG
jgi:hypothetical protein